MFWNRVFFAAEDGAGGGGSAPASGDDGGATGGAPAQPQATPQAQPNPEPNQPPEWASRRIDTLTGNWREEQRRAEALTRELEELKAKLAAPPTPAAAPTQAPAIPNPGLSHTDIEALVNTRAAQQRFNEQCNNLFQEGSTEYTDFPTAIESFKQVGGLPPSMLEATIAIPGGHKVLYALAKDLNETTRIMSLPPVQQAASLAIYAAKNNLTDIRTPLPRRQTGAPPPLPTRVGSGDGENRGTVDLYSPSTGKDEWFEARLAQKRAGSGRRR